MHRRARRGERVDLPASQVTIHEIELLSVDLPELRFTLRCSTGTYVRAIARDLGEALGVGAHLTELRRTGIGSFRATDAISVDALTDGETVGRAAVEPLDALRHMPSLEVDDDDARKLIHGQKVRLTEEVAPGRLAVSRGGVLLAIAEVEDGLLIPRKVFAA